MAHYTEGTAAGPGAGDVFFQALRAHLGSNSWTEHDVISNSSGTRNIVFRGSALDATADIRPFLQIQQTSTTLIVFIGYADWDTTTHTGIAAAGSTAASGVSFTDSTFPYACCFDGFGGIVACRSSGSWQRAFVGFANRGLNSDEVGITKSTGSLSAAATSIAVASDMTGKLRVGQKVQVMNYAHASGNTNAAHCEQVTISSIAAGSLGVSALVNNYDSGAVIGDNVCPMIVGNGSSSVGTAGATTFFLPYNLDGSRSSATAQTANALGQTVATPANVDPTDITNRYGTGLFAFSETTAAKLDFKGYARGVYCTTAGAGGGGAGGGPSAEDLFTGAGFTWLCIDGTSTQMTFIGPRET